MKISLLCNEQRRIVAYPDGLQAKVNVLRELRAESQAELHIQKTLKVSQTFRV